MAENLTVKQKEAVESTAGATLVIAGPGTGKTHILASRIAHLVRKRGVKPERILCLTFTNAAAAAMRQRVIAFLNRDGYRVDIGTFHSFASRLIDENPEVLGFRRSLRALTDIDRVQLIRSLIDALYEEGVVHELTTPQDRYFYYYDIAKAISDLKREGYDPSAFKNAVTAWEKEFSSVPDEKKRSTRGSRAGKLKLEYEREAKRIEKNKELVAFFERYEQALAEQSAYDYEDMILKAVRGIEATDALKQELHNTYDALMVDEYQDTNGAQNRLLFALINHDAPNVFVVGDDDQAIHRFQGATIRNFADFVAEFPKTAIVALEDNFRSPQFILDAALAVAKQNNERLTRHLDLPDKFLRAHGEHASRQSFVLNEFATDAEEHAFLLEQLQALHAHGASWNSFAILTRTNNEQRELAELLRRADIPYSLSAEQNALAEPRTAALFAMVRACMNPHENDDLLALLLHPATPIATEDAWHIMAQRMRHESIYQALARAIRNPRGELFNRETARATFYTINDLSEGQHVLSAAHWLQEVITKTGFLSWVLKQEDAPFIIANVRALTDEAKRVQEGNPALSMRYVLEHFSAFRELGVPLKPTLSPSLFENTVKIMTAHNAKGQEFDHVFVVHAVHEVWAQKRGRNKITLPASVPARQETEEDARRLFYVALTRAKKDLFVTYANVYTRGIGGAGDRARETTPAIFVAELAPHITPSLLSQDVRAVGQYELTPPPAPSGIQQEVARAIVSGEKFALNPTKLNTFLECPKRFLYEQVLRVPKVKTFSLTYGEVVHAALQHYFEGPKNKRTIAGLMETVERHLRDHSTLTDAQNKRIVKRARETFRGYLPRLAQEPEPIAVEYSHAVTEIDGVRVSGKIDKITPLTSGSVNVVDYKTSKAKTLNAILGKTKDTHAPNLLRQLLFYKLLLENDPRRAERPEEFTLDFVDANKAVAVPLSTDQYAAFQKQLKNAWNSIQTLAFLETSEEFPHCGECAYCRLDV